METVAQKPTTDRLKCGDGADLSKVDQRVLNLAHLDHYTGGDRVLARDLLILFEAQADSQFKIISESLDETDWEISVHTLKGGARGVGATIVAELAEKIENIGFDGDRGQMSAVKIQLEQALKTCVTAIQPLI